MRILIRKRSLFPECIREFKELKGICIGECVDKKWQIASEHLAHAHCMNTCYYRGWICLRYKYQLKEKYTLLHEMGHLIANRFGNIPDHGKQWRAAVKRIGGTYKSYVNLKNNIRYIDYTYSDPQRKIKKI